MASLHDRIRFLTDCYRADTRTGGLLDVFASKVEHRKILRGREEVWSEGRNPLVVPTVRFHPMANAAALARREKSLRYGLWLLVAKVAAEDDDAASGTHLAAPLVTFPARLTVDPEYPEGMMPLSVETGQPSVNFLALARFLGDEAAALDAVGILEDALEDGPDAFAEQAARVLGVKLSHEPEGALVGPKKVFAARRAVKAGGPPRLLPVALVTLSRNSFETRGVLDELRHMGESKETSPPLTRLLAPAPVPAVDVSPRPAHAGTVPTVLSEPQRRILAAADHHELSVVVGSPGTGKSYTLAAAALDQLARGRTVLISARSQQALDVLEDKIATLLGDPDLAVAAGRREKLTDLRDRLQDLLLRGLGADPAPDRSLEELRGELRRIEQRLDRAAEAIAARNRTEIAWGRAHAGPPFDDTRFPPRSWKRWWHHLRLRRQPPFWDAYDLYGKLLEERNRAAVLALRTTIHRRRADALKTHRKTLRAFADALKARHSSRQERLFGALDLSVLLSTFPLWLVPFADLHRILPRRSGLFDLVMVDEATQCDPASGLPAVLRGRRLVVAGDPRQLRHVSFLSRAHLGTLAERHGLTEADLGALDYREHSLLDLALDAAPEESQITTLDEHFRSSPRLIEFSNREFYRSRLRVMHQRPQVPVALHVNSVTGRRDDEGVNEAEVERVTADVAALVAEQQALPDAAVTTLGVLSPFRAQTDRLAEALGRALSPSALERHRLKVATPYGFQGEERDRMLLSFALDDGSGAMSFRYLERPDVFNVAVTRARNRQDLYVSFDPRALSPGSLLHRYLAHARHPVVTPDAAPDPTTDAAKDPFVRQVAEALRPTCRVWPAFSVAGIEIDLLVTRDDGPGRAPRAVGVDLIGQPGTTGDSLHLERYRILRRAGLRVLPLTLWSWERDPAACVGAVHAALAGDARIPEGGGIIAG